MYILTIVRAELTGYQDGNAGASEVSVDATETDLAAVSTISWGL